MSLAEMLREVAVVTRAGTVTTRAGDVVPDPASATIVGTYPAFFQARSAREDVDHRDRQELTARVYLPADADVTGSDLIVNAATGQMFEVVGPPMPAGRPGPAQHHLEINIREVRDGSQPLRR